MQKRSIYALCLLTAVSFFNYLDRMVIAVLLEPIKHDLSLSDSQMGLITGLAFAALYATLGLPLARLADRHSRVTLISICLAVWSAMTALTGMARNFVELFVARMAVGVGEAGCTPAAHSLLGDLFSRERRALAVSIFQAGGLLGQSAGVAIAAAVGQLWGWRTALLVVGIAGIPLALLMFFTVREPLREKPREFEAAETLWETLAALSKRPALIHLVLALSIASFGGFGMVQWLPAFFMRSHGLSMVEVGLLIGSTGLFGGVFGAVAGGYVVSRLSARDLRWELWWPAIVLAPYSLFLLASFLVVDWRLAMGLLSVAFFVGASSNGVALSAIQTYVEPSRRAVAIAMVMLLSSLVGMGLGPMAVGGISDLLRPSAGTESLRYALVVMLSMPLWASLHFWLASRSSKISADRVAHS